jgi:hypothetical protein
MIHSRIPSLRAAATIAFSESFLHELPAVEAQQFGISADGLHRCLPPEETQERVALLAEFPKSLAATARLFLRDHSDVAGDGFAVGEPSWIAKKTLQ